MTFSVQLGLALALATALASIFGFLYKHRGAVESPPVDWRAPLRSSFALFRSRWYVLGIAIATLGWGLHVAALALAPISLVQATIAGGLVLLTVIADRFFAHRVTRREWIGVALTAAGLAFLAATLDGTGESAHSAHESSTLIAYAGVATVLAVAAAVAGTRTGANAGPWLAASAGLLWGASDVTIKAASDFLADDGILVLLSPLAAAIALLSLAGLVVSAKSLQVGTAVAVIAITSAAANIVTIASGPVVFAEPMPEEPFALALRIAAFALVITAAALTPPPLAAAELDPALEPA